MKSSPRGKWAIYDRATGLIVRVVSMSRRTAIMNMREGQWLVPCTATSYPPGYRVVERQIVAGALPEAPVSVSVRREQAILAVWPVSQQMEALTEAQMGRPDKLLALKEHIQAVKAQFPKETTDEDVAPL